MRKNILVAGVAAALLIPTLALAQETCEQRSANRTAGTIVGAGVGALLGSAVAGSGHKGDGAIVGGVGGAIIGNQAARGSSECVHAYGYYDNNGSWHSNAVARTEARGYYDRNGNWIDGAPPSGRWDNDGRWVVASSAPDYARRDAYGYYDRNGDWHSNAVARAEARGYYDRNGAWIEGSPPSGRWDNDGRWVVIAPSAPVYGAPANYVAGRRDTVTREAYLEDRIHQARMDGSLSRYEARNATRTLDSIRRQEAQMRHYNGRLNDRDEAYIQAKLDVLSRQVRADRRD